jgi:hypothetical protein
MGDGDGEKKCRRNKGKENVFALWLLTSDF